MVLPIPSKFCQLPISNNYTTLLTMQYQQLIIALAVSP